MNYKVLSQQSFYSDEFSLIPIRMEDRWDIMKWRNEQIYHLRQNKPLTKEDQDFYFKEVISKLFDQEQPNQILFSFLKNETCIGYGGLVHINWIDQHAEISLVLNTNIEGNHFINSWNVFLKILKQIAFKELNFHKIFTYAYDMRPHLYDALHLSGFVEEARLKEHCRFNDKYFDVLYHACTNPIEKLDVRAASLDDMELIFNWANDYEVRKFALNSEPIQWDNHKVWYTRKIQSNDCKIFIFQNSLGTPIGQVRIEKEVINDIECWIIDYSIDKNFRGLGLGSKIIEQLIVLNPNIKLKAIVKVSNIFSIRIFQSLYFNLIDKNETLLTFIK